MSATTFVLIASCFFAFANALQCYNCMGQSSDCESGPMISCPGVSEFCKLEWKADTGYTSQTCAVQQDCPVGGGMAKRQAEFDDMGHAAANDISNCCNYDGCNCIGTQCSRSSKLAYGVVSMIAIALAFLFS